MDSHVGAAPSDSMAKMDAQMKNMREMHEKMTSAKTPEEHNKLMAEHMKAMQDGMKMMDGMSSSDMGGWGGMKGMQAMMQMMMDRIPASPAKQ